MQTLKVFIVVEGESGKDELRIDGNLETLRAFLSGVGTLEIQGVTVPNVAVAPGAIELADKPKKTAKVKR